MNIEYLPLSKLQCILHERNHDSYGKTRTECINTLYRMGIYVDPNTENMYTIERSLSSYVEKSNRIILPDSTTSTFNDTLSYTFDSALSYSDATLNDVSCDNVIIFDNLYYQEHDLIYLLKTISDENDTLRVNLENVQANISVNYNKFKNNNYNIFTSNQKGITEYITSLLDYRLSFNYETSIINYLRIDNHVNITIVINQLSIYEYVIKSNDHTYMLINFADYGLNISNNIIAKPFYIYNNRGRFVELLNPGMKIDNNVLSIQTTIIPQRIDKDVNVYLQFIAELKDEYFGVVNPFFANKNITEYIHEYATNDDGISLNNGVIDYVFNESVIYLQIHMDITLLENKEYTSIKYSLQQKFVYDLVRTYATFTIQKSNYLNIDGEVYSEGNVITFDIFKMKRGTYKLNAYLEIKYVNDVTRTLKPIIFDMDFTYETTKINTHNIYIRDSILKNKKTLNNTYIITLNVIKIDRYDPFVGLHIDYDIIAVEDTIRITYNHIYDTLNRNIRNPYFITHEVQEQEYVYQIGYLNIFENFEIIATSHNSLYIKIKKPLLEDVTLIARQRVPIPYVLYASHTQIFVDVSIFKRAYKYDNVLMTVMV